MITDTKQQSKRLVGTLLRWLALSVLFVGTHALAQSTGTVTYVYTDPQGTPLAEADASGNITATFDYTPYGTYAPQGTSTPGPAPKGPGYTGHVNDPETNLVYMQARYYDSATGHFVSVDPVSPTAGNTFNFNRFAYANDNPSRYIDPDGRCADGVSCDQMVQSYGKWASNHPEEANELGRTIGLPGVMVMLSATGLSEVVGIARTAQAIDKAQSDASQAPAGKTYTTYTRTRTDGVVYSGRTKGTGTPEQQVAARTRQPDHQAKTAEGYGPATVDRNSPNPDAIRGREQQLIEQNGGAQSQGGTSGNKINGVSPNNPNATRYQNACAREFGC